MSTLKKIYFTILDATTDQSYKSSLDLFLSKPASIDALSKLENCSSIEEWRAQHIDGKFPAKYLTFMDDENVCKALNCFINAHNPVLKKLAQAIDDGKMPNVENFLIKQGVSGKSSLLNLCEDFKDIIIKKNVITDTSQLPQYTGRKLDWANLVGYRIGYDPISTARNFMLVRAKDGKMNSIPAMRPVHDFVFQTMNQCGLIDAIKDLEDDFITIKNQVHKAGKTTDSVREEINERIARFASKNRIGLQAFHKQMDLLHDHVKQTFASYERDGRFVAMSVEARSALLEFLSDMSLMANNLQKPDFGGENTEEGRFLHKLKDVKNITNLRKAIPNINNKIAVLADIGYQTLNPDKARLHVRDAILRGLQVGYYNPHGRDTLPDPEKVAYNPQKRIKAKTRKENSGNIEFVIMDGEDGLPKMSWSKGGDHKQLLSFITTVYDAGYSEAEAIETIQRVMDAAGDGAEPISNATIDDLRAKYKDNEHYQHFVSALAEWFTPTGLKGKSAGFFAEGRGGRQFYAKASKFWRYCVRFPEPGDWIALPGVLELKQRFIYSPITGICGFPKGAKVRLFKWEPGHFWTTLRLNPYICDLEDKLTKEDDNTPPELRGEKNHRMRKKCKYPEEKFGLKGQYTNATRRTLSLGLFSRHGLATMAFLGASLITGNNLQEDFQRGTAQHFLGQGMEVVGKQGFKLTGSAYATVYGDGVYNGILKPVASNTSDKIGRGFNKNVMQGIFGVDPEHHQEDVQYGEGVHDYMRLDLRGKLSKKSRYKLAASGYGDPKVLSFDEAMAFYDELHREKSEKKGLDL